MEIPKRLTPKTKTLRDLYLKSGNECAFPECPNKIVDSDGTLIGELCHIEAALPGGERFNKNQTNEQRRSFDNLLLMCSNHHKVTNNVNKYPVKKLKKIKDEHESRFTYIIDKMQESFKDFLEDQEIIECLSLEKLLPAEIYNLSDKELEVSLNELNQLANKLKDVTKGAKELLSIIINRAHDTNRDPGFYSSEITVDELAAITKTSKKTLHPNLFFLINKGFIDIEKNDYDLDTIYLINLLSGWNVWVDLKIYCKNNNIDLTDIIVDLDFSLIE